MLATSKYNFLLLFVCLLLAFSPAGTAMAVNLTADEMKSVLQIAKTVHLAKSSLDESKCMEYSVAIYRASKRFDIDPNLLVAIAAQETSFREDLPEGKAGEFGIVQIRKIWMNNTKFRSVFKNAKVKDLNKPSKAFLYAAWILRDLKDNAAKSTIPFWAYYNAVRFENRLKYFLAVNQKLSYLNKGESFPRIVATNIQVNGEAHPGTWKPDNRMPAAKNDPFPAVEAVKVATTPLAMLKLKPETEAEPELRLEAIKTASLGGSNISVQRGGWIDMALQRLHYSQNSSPKIREKTNKNISPVNFRVEADLETRTKLLQTAQD